ncbi:inovirus Gp2 family protein [Pseudomonas sp. ANT_H14]|uniref:YagK/YfjJ domain-containing protein n=1 Tax=unclassified Pseudomonas TaxID=196821 RepID=UPI0011EE96FB|nr:MULTISPECIES: inovirus-type Gp2 protein [unclassified Pseudomonas]KAA0950111.1 inovirus Gp2 family protein [Pseudomonas sp. ANT_H14]
MYSDDLDDYSPDSSGEIVYEVLTEEQTLLEKLKQIEPVVVQVLSSREQLFSSVVHKRSGLAFQATPLGKQLLMALKNGSGEFHCYFPLCDLNPYVAILFECAEKFDSLLLLSSTAKISPSEVPKEVSVMNCLVEDLRKEAAGSEFKKIVKKFVNAENKRARSIEQYIDALFAKHSRMVVIRLDLWYETGFFRERKDLKKYLTQVREDWAKLQGDLHKGSPIKGMLGFACKLEYGHLKGFHFHLLVFYNGADYREDIILAKLIGEHWRQEITKGKGRYFNCNNKKGSYRFLGIGVMNWFDKNLVSNLKAVVVMYLVKTDYWLRFSSGCGRSFFRGNMPKAKGVKRGRPRSVVV